MPEDKRGLGEHPNSILAKLDGMDVETKRTFLKNVRKHSDDAKALESWADQGFSSEQEEIDEDFSSEVLTSTPENAMV